MARLIPVSGIANAVEAELRATSALLSVLTVVRDLSIAITAPLGASTARRATVEAFIETGFKLGDGRVVRPDGLIQVTYGSAIWRALVEVKTGNNCLEADQVNAYLIVAREQSYDAVITISNEIAFGTTHPCDGVKVRSNSKVRLAHYSWTEILASAVRTKVHRGVDDPEQAWILGELIRYLEHRASGAMAFDDMGANWVAVRDGAREGSLRKTADDVRDVARRWDQLMRFAALQLGADTGVAVQHVVPKSQQDSKARLAYLIDAIAGLGQLDGVLRVPGAAGNIHLFADLRARQLGVAAEITAPADRGSRARVTWLTRQLGADTPETLVIEAWPRLARQPLVATLAQAREDPAILVDIERRDTLRYRLILRSEMGQGRKDGGRSPGFITSVMSLLRTFYATTLQQVTPWIAKAPQSRPSGQPADLKQEPIRDEEELQEAITAARDDVDERTGDAPPPTARAVEESDREQAAAATDSTGEEAGAGVEPSVDEDYVAASAGTLDEAGQA